ncbi:MAG: S-layer homology domain-containing protein, partial [Clostridia bacterium]|nr:S-layer homology domain-containing protein [Clostridia bacterium]
MKKLLTLILAAVMLTGVFSLAAAGEDSPFTDVKTSRWSYGYVTYAYEMGYMNGVGDGKFDPAGTMTRGMVVTVLWRRDGSPAVEFTNDFDDVKEGKYYSAAVIWAKNNGIVNGVSEGKFDPGGKITREQLATMLNRYAEYHSLEFRPAGELDSFPDASKVHSYAKNALSWATGKRLITGVKAGNEDLLDPRGNATREQFATILKRFDDTDLTLPLEYNQPVLMSRYTEKDYPLVTDADFYVATDGNDSAAGTLEAPFASFARAAEAARELKKTRAAGDVTVAFRAGDYGPMDYCFTAEDSGDENGRIIYCAYGDGKVQFTGGPVVALDEFVPLDDADKAHFSAGAAEHIKKADLSEKRCADMLSYSSETFTYGHGRIDAARYPNRNASGDEIYL